MRRPLASLIGLSLSLGLTVAALAIGPGDAREPSLTPPGTPPQHAASLPKVGPFPPARLRAPTDATAQASGTGFFATTRAVVTAAHVVNDCRAIHLVSQHLPPTEARLLAVDAENDIAILVADAAAPAHLDIGGTGITPTRVLVYGFPATARQDVPNTTWASLVNNSLVNDRLGQGTTLQTDPHALLWMQNRDIAQGYSGGPILNPANGQVLGIVRALIDPERAVAAYGIATPDLSIGPGVAPLRAILARESIAHDAAPSSAEDMFTRARKATVHVFCWQ